MKNKERLKDCHRSKENEEALYLSASWTEFWNRKKDVRKTENSTIVCSLVSNIMPMLTSAFL